MPSISIVYSNNIDNVGTRFHTILFSCGIVMAHKQYRAKIEIVWIDIKSTGFLSFHITHAISILSCMCHNVIPCAKFLKALVLLKSTQRPTLPDFILLHV